MLRTLRSGGLMQILMVGVVFAIIAVFVLEFRAAGGSQSGSLERQCVTRVDGHCVSVKDYMASYGLVVPRQVSAKAVKQLSLREHILTGLVERELLVAEAERLGVSVSEQALDDELAMGHAHVSLPAAHTLRLGYQLDLTEGDTEGYAREMVRELPVLNSKTREFDYDVYKRVVRNTTRRSVKEFKALQRRELVAARMRDLVRSRVRISADEAFEAYEKDRSRAVVRFVKVDREWFARYAADGSDAAADAFAKANEPKVDEAWKSQSQSFKKDCRLASEIFVATPAATSDDDKVLLREAIDTARQRLDDGTPFDEVAREISEGPTAALGGRIGCIGDEAAAKQFTEAHDALETGAVSPVIETERGFHLLRAEGRLEGDPEAYGRREAARQLAVSEAAARLAEDFAKALVKRAGVQVKLEDAVQELIVEFAGLGKGKQTARSDEETESAAERDDRRPKVEISAPFTVNQSPVPGAFPTVSVGKLAFELEKVDAVHPEPIPTLSGFAVMQLKEKTPVTRDEFEKEKDVVLRQLRQAKEADALTRYVDGLRERYKEELEVNAALVEDASSEDDDA